MAVWWASESVPTAATALLPIAVSIIRVVPGSVTTLSETGRRDFQCALLPGIAYSASIGVAMTLAPRFL